MGELVEDRIVCLASHGLLLVTATSCENARPPKTAGGPLCVCELQVAIYLQLLLPRSQPRQHVLVIAPRLPLLHQFLRLPRWPRDRRVRRPARRTSARHPNHSVNRCVFVKFVQDRRCSIDELAQRDC